MRAITTARRPRTAALLAALAAAALLAGCAGGAVAGSPTGTSGSTVPTTATSQTSGTTGATQSSQVTPAQVPGYPTRPDRPVISVVHTMAGVGGISGEQRLVVYGDGTVLRPDEDGTGWTVAVLAPGELDALMIRATELGLLGDLDMGEPGITDSPWTTMTITLATREIEHRVYAPGYEEGLTGAQVDHRRAFGALSAEIAGLAGDRLTAPAAPYEVSRYRLMARYLPLDGDPVPEQTWGGPTSLRELLGDSGCAELAGQDAAAAAVLLAGTEDDVMVGGALTVGVSTGVATPESLWLSFVPLLPGDEGCPSTGAPASELTAPWPGENRRPATAWEQWIATQSVHEAGADGLLGPDASSAADLTWYDLTFSVATADGRTVVDVTAQHRHSGSGDDPQTFAVRVDASTGELLEHR
ncbi:hypothetical protein GIS00_01840 [Nakamurella sp. YIM 132087]|uniref:Uncharacterized protein n=1 Tax=Nakamurella alba TaxID=2665158 RepID=A0A7K1FF04_9ACTN|nr:hypothetical protein [Nakamurella alba]MTD12687.1 hypothetical protein [Nakamurella alba]